MIESAQPGPGLALYRPLRQRSDPAAVPDQSAGRCLREAQGAPWPRSDPGGGQNLCGDHKRRPAGSPAQIFAKFKRGIDRQGGGAADICRNPRTRPGG